MSYDRGLNSKVSLSSSLGARAADYLIDLHQTLSSRLFIPPITHIRPIVYAKYARRAIDAFMRPPHIATALELWTTELTTISPSVHIKREL